MNAITILDKEVVKEFLQSDLEDIEIPKNINFDDLVNIFIDYCEDDYHCWKNTEKETIAPLIQCTVAEQ